jgi:hypothetical protein
MGHDDAGLGIDHPDQPDAGIQPLGDLAVDFADAVGRRRDLGDEVGCQLRELLAFLAGRNAVGPDEGHIGGTHGVRAAAQHEPGLSGPA